jgi:uncharacterized repeat protein (TIGR03803 family)
MRPKQLRPRADRFLMALLMTFVVATSAHAAHEKVLHNFVAFPRGANPQANLIADAAGNLYGTTPHGGRYGYGTVFELTAGKNNKWTETILYNFTGGTDGANPVAGLVFDGAGKLYGTTATGGIVAQDCYYSYSESSCGVVFELSPGTHGTWTESVLYSFNGYPNDGQNPVTSLIFDNAGHLYGTTDRGGTYGEGTVFELTPGSNGVWTEVILYAFTGSADGAGPGGSLILDSAGNLYGTTAYGGDLNCIPGYTGGCGTVFELTPNGKGAWTEAILHSFTSNDGAFPLGSLVFDPLGNLYGTTTTGPGFACNYGGCGTVFRLTPNSDGSWTQTMLYNFEGGPDGFQPVGGLVLDGAGNLYGTTEWGGGLGSCYVGCGTVFELSARSKDHWTEKVIHRFGLPAQGQNEGTQLMSSLLLDPAGNLYGTAMNGGDESCNNFTNLTGCGAVFKLSPASGGKWTTSSLYAFSASPLGVGPGGLFLDNIGNLFGVTQGGGSADHGTAIELMPKASGGWKAFVLHTFVGGNDGATPGSSLIADEAGNLYGTTINGGSQECSYYLSCGGVVFELSPTAQGWKESVIHRFGKNNNRGYQGPAAGLVLDSTGNLYGTTVEGGSSNCGSYGCGTVYRLSPVGGGKWREDLLYLFQGGSDGAYPFSSMVFDHAGNLYGTTCGGGANSSGTVFELAPTSGNWKERVLYSFQGLQGGDGNCPYAGVIFDDAGNLYGTTFYGGSDSCSGNGGGCGVVFKLSPLGGGHWKETVLHAFKGTDGSNPESALTLDAAGNLYGTAPFDGNDYFASGVVFQLSPSSKGWTEHVLHRFGNGLDGSGPNGALIFDSAGDIYGTTDAGGTGGGGTIFELSPSSDGDWVDDLAISRPHPRQFSPDAKRELRLVPNLPQAR